MVYFENVNFDLIRMSHFKRNPKELFSYQYCPYKIIKFSKDKVESTFNNTIQVQSTLNNKRIHSTRVFQEEIGGNLSQPHNFSDRPPSLYMILYRLPLPSLDPARGQITILIWTLVWSKTFFFYTGFNWLWLNTALFIAKCPSVWSWITDL